MKIMTTQPLTTWEITAILKPANLVVICAETVTVTDGCYNVQCRTLFYSHCPVYGPIRGGNTWSFFSLFLEKCWVVCKTLDVRDFSSSEHFKNRNYCNWLQHCKWSIMCCILIRIHMYVVRSLRSTVSNQEMETGPKCMTSDTPGNFSTVY